MPFVSREELSFALFQKVRITVILGEIEYLIKFLERALRAEFALHRNICIKIYKLPKVKLSRSDIKEKVEKSPEFQSYRSHIRQTLTHDYDTEEENNKFWSYDWG